MKDTNTDSMSTKNDKPYCLVAEVSTCPSSIVYNEDCVSGLKRFPDKHFDLAIVDPPYGIEDRISKGGGSHTKSNCKFHQLYSENNKSWDIKPTNEYWDELFRVSKNQIIWGGKLL